MNVTSILAYLFAATSVLASIYVAISRDLLRVTLAFFVELACVGGVLLSLNADYLALFVFAVALMGTIIVITFSSVILGGLKESFRHEERGGSLLTRVFGMILGLSLGGAVGWALLTAPFIESLKVPEPTKDMADVALLGRMLLGEQVAVFEVLGVIILVVIVGGGLLLRKPTDAN